MSMPAALLVRKGYAHGATIGSSFPVAADQNNFLPVSEAEWRIETFLRISDLSSTDRIITGFQADGVRAVYTLPIGGHMHPAGFKRFIMDWSPNTNGVLLTHQDGASLAANRFRLPDAKPLLLLAGDAFSMTWDNPDWRIREVSRNAASIRIAPNITADQTDYSPPGLRVADRVLLSSDAARTIHSLAADDGVLPSTSWLAHKDQKRIYNGGTFNITFPNESATGTAIYKIRTFSGGSLILAPNNFVDAYYDDDLERWRMG